MCIGIAESIGIHFHRFDKKPLRPMSMLAYNFANLLFDFGRSKHSEHFVSYFINFVINYS